MGRTRANGVEIEFETIGPHDGRPLLLVMGLGGQLIHWPDELCEMFAERGHLVIRFDNRDSGLSTWFDGDPSNLAGALGAAFGGPPAEVPYRLEDMADDAGAVLDAAGVESAHVVGASMGGMVAQMFVLRHEDRTRSLTSIMSSPEFVAPEPDVVTMLATPAPSDREANIERSVADVRLLAGPAYPYDEEEVRRLAGLAFDRGFHPEGVERQLAAILASGGRREALARLRVPTLVIHGDSDRLIPPLGGRLTAQAIPDAELLVIEGMGHDMPRAVWPGLVGAISALTERADAARVVRAGEGAARPRAPVTQREG